MKNKKKQDDGGKKKTAKKSLSEVDNSLQIDGDKIHGGDVRITPDVGRT